MLLSSPGAAKIIAERIAKEVDAYCAESYNDGHRKHLGASLIGRNCKRYLWYVFRWAQAPKFSGRQQRLFNRGHREESRFIEWLEGIGFKIWFENRKGFWYHPESDSYGLAEDENLPNELCDWIDENAPNYLEHVARAKAQGLEFPQYRISGCNGHFGGSLDGIAEFPPSWGINEPVLLEFKTHGTGHKFESLKERGMILEKKDHFAQTSVYGYKYNFNYVLYLSINKNDDDLHIELVKLDFKLGKQMELKAEEIIFSQMPPAKLSENPTYQECRFCDMLEVCHKGKPLEKNCRSCINAKPVENGKWWCNLHSPVKGVPIPDDIIPNACPSYQSIENVRNIRKQ